MQVNFRKFVNVTMHDWISFLKTSKILYSFDGHELNIITITYSFDAHPIKGFLAGNINNGIILCAFF